jgi:8-oxo-dGTP diphosphatase
MKNRHKNIPACYLFLIQNNKTLLLKRANTNHENGNYSLIAGHVEAGETFVQSIIREAKEESGIDIKSQDLELVHLMHRGNKIDHNDERVDVFFTVSKWEGEIENKEPHKCDDLSWFDLNNLPPNTITYIKQAIEAIQQKQFYSEFGW